MCRDMLRNRTKAHLEDSGVQTEEGRIIRDDAEDGESIGAQSREYSISDDQSSHPVQQEVVGERVSEAPK